MLKKIASLFSRSTEPFIWIQVDPSQPHAGLSTISDEKASPWEKAIKVTGVDAAFARSHYVGKVLHWERFSDSQRKKIESAKLEISSSEFNAFFR